MAGVRQRQLSPALNLRQRRELDELWRTLRAGSGSHSPSRRDLLRWSAITGGAVAAAQSGVGRRTAVARARQEGEIEQGAEIMVPFEAFGQEISLDPHRSADYGGFWVMYPNVWGGLLRYDELGRPELDLAESYAVSDDGLTYTFRIRPDAFYASGNPVVAGDFVQSWVRALDPANPSPMAFFMRYVAGYQEFLDQAEGAQIGFRAPDEATVEITLAEPVSFFTSYLAAFVWAVVDPLVLRDTGQRDFVINGAGTGPWQFDTFQLDTEFTMVPNPNYYGGPPPSLERIVWPILTGPDAAREALDRYLDDEAVSADVPLSLLGEVEADETLAAELIRLDQFPGTVRSLAMDFQQEPFGDVRVRRAFALALDRERYSEIYQGTWTPSSAFIPPAVRELAGYEPPEGLEFDPDTARSLLAEAGYPDGQDFPEVVYYIPAGESPEEIERVSEVLAGFEETLGVTITLDDSRTVEQLAELLSDDGGRQFDIIWWQYVTDTPHLLSLVCSPDSSFMAGVFNWSPDLEPSANFDPGADAAAFTELMAEADTEQDEATRNDLYRQGEELVLQNAVYIPIANWIPMFVQKPWLLGTRHGPWTGRLPVLFDAEVVVAGR